MSRQKKRTRTQKRSLSGQAAARLAAQQRSSLTKSWKTRMETSVARRGERQPGRSS